MNFRITGSRVDDSNTPVVDVEDTDIEHHGKTYRVDHFYSDAAPGSADFVYASGIMLKKNGELSNVRKSNIPIPLPPHIKEAFAKLGATKHMGAQFDE